MVEYWMVEYTDTYGGEANYGWVRRIEICLPFGASQLKIMRHAKAKIGLTGVKGRTVNYDDCYEFRPYGFATVMFVSLSEEEAKETNKIGQR